MSWRTSISNSSGSSRLGTVTGRSDARPSPQQPAGEHGPRGQRPGQRPGLGYGYVHTALDDHSRLAYSEDNHHRTHPALGGLLSASRVATLSGHNS